MAFATNLPSSGFLSVNNPETTPPLHRTKGLVMSMRQVAFSMLLLLLCGSSHTRALDLILPTDNNAIFAGRPEDFYMYVNRYLGGVKTTPWEGGMYGFVRDPIPTPDGGTLYKRFHAGMDIKPLKRDAKGNPLDEIHAIAGGRIVHTSPEAGASNFGKYLVIEHHWDGCPYYSLYAHLSEIYVQPGAEVKQGDTIARMGYTGRGIDRERSHLHLEVALMMNENFGNFYDVAYGPTKNRHGVYNGLNFRGVDVARLYRESRALPKLTIPEFLSREEAFFQVSLPGTVQIDLLKRYPWMLKQDAAPGTGVPGGWRISFTRAGVPLRVERSNETIPALAVAVLRPAPHSLSHLTRGLVSGTSGKPTLTGSGKKLVDLLTQEPRVVAQTHTIKKGETLEEIATQHGVAVPELRAANSLEAAATLTIGKVLVIPRHGEERGGE